MKESQPLRLVIDLAMVIAVAETLAMIILQYMPPMSVYMTALFDSALLLLLISPALYFIFFRSLLHQITTLRQVQRDMEQLNLDLEKRVGERTAQLHMELEERKRIEERLVEHQGQLRSMSSQLAVVEEQERNRIAAELHDNIGHTLAIVNNRLGMLRLSLSADQEKKTIDDIKELINEALSYSRSLSSDLSLPLLINDLPFMSALEWLGEEVLERNGVAFSIKADGAPDLPAGDTRVIFIRAIRELLVNAVKHAKARNVEISVRRETSNIVVEIKDDGTGFDIDSLSPVSLIGQQKLGIITVRERMTYMNGNFLIISEPGRGTTITLSMPYKPKKSS
ncbi:MAG: hypothetical protein HZC48_11480 [Nitrospirae bacterium]|nr:hypothetical protein [Nitrospirota bacterium]